jgi:hypothetical protein
LRSYPTLLKANATETMKIAITILLISSLTFSLHTNAQTITKMNLQSRQDTINKKVTQKIFDEEVSFDYSDFYDLKNNKSYDRFFVGNLTLTTGQVVCTDPMYRELGFPQSWTTKPGDYAVYLYIGLDSDFEGRVAYAELCLKDEIPAYWEMSLIAEDLLADNFEKQMNGLYPVENGLGSFSDYETWKLYIQEISNFYKGNNEGNYYDSILDTRFKANKNIPASSRGEDWINYQPTNAIGNIIMFGSGMGDGLYPRYVGYDKSGQVIKLVTDFIQLTDPAEKD